MAKRTGGPAGVRVACGAGGRSTVVERLGSCSVGEPEPYYDLEGGSWCPVPNEIHERLMLANLSRHESRVLQLILRKTFGFHLDGSPKNIRKTSDRIPLSQFEKATGLDRRRVSEALRRLVERRIIGVRGINTQIKTYWVNLNVAEWQLSYLARTDSEPNFRKTVLARQDKLSCVGGIELSGAARTNLSYAAAPSKEAAKENSKENSKECVAVGDAYPASRAASPHVNSDDRKALSEFRNVMMKSKLYADDELCVLRGKRLDELKMIHSQRLASVRNGAARAGV